MHPWRSKAAAMTHLAPRRVPLSVPCPWARVVAALQSATCCWVNLDCMLSKICEIVLSWVFCRSPAKLANASGLSRGVLRICPASACTIGQPNINTNAALGIGMTRALLCVGNKGSGALCPAVGSGASCHARELPWYGATRRENCTGEPRSRSRTTPHHASSQSVDQKSTLPRAARERLSSPPPPAVPLGRAARRFPESPGCFWGRGRRDSAERRPPGGGWR